MATKNGSAVNLASGIRGRLVLTATYSPTTITTSTSSVTVSWNMKIVLIDAGYANDTGTYSITGSDTASGSRSWSLSGAGDSYTIISGTDTVSLTYGSSQTWTLSGSLNNAVLADLSVSGLALSIPARPYAVPAAQSGLVVARSSDTRQNLSWSRNATTAAPYSSQEVWRSVDGGAYVRIASGLSGTATSWSDTSTSANHRYFYRLKAVNSAGTSGYSNTDAISTTPSKPSAPTATKLSTGDIRVTRPALSSVAVTWEVKAAGGATLATGIPASTFTWTHSAPNPLVTHTYVIRAVSTDPTLYSDYSENSNTVQLLTAPAAPTNLSPNGAVRDMTDPTPLSWSHNPIDSSEQTAYQIRRRRAGGSWTTDAKVTSSVEGATWPANFYANGGANIEWEVRTWGAATTGGSDGTGASPWSATATIQPYAQPVAGTVDPDGTTDVTLPSHLFQWSFYQEQGLTQSQWEIEVFQNNLAVAGGSGSGTQTTWQSPSVFENGNTYYWRVRVRDSKGVWSDWTPDQSFDVVFVPPNPPVVDSEWNRDGYVLLQIEPNNDGIVPDTVTVTIQRSMNGEDWVTLASGLPAETDYLDWTATVAGQNCYRIISETAAGATAEYITCVEVSGDDHCDVYIGGGPDFWMTVRFGYAKTLDITVGRDRVLHEFDGRALPVETSGPMVPLSISVKATLPTGRECNDYGVHERRAIENIFRLPGPHLYRDWTGRHMFVSLSQLNYNEDYLGEVSFSVTEADGGTDEQRSSMGSYVGPFMTESPDGEYRIVGGTLIETSPGEWTWTP